MSQLVGPLSPRQVGRRPDSWKKLRSVGGQMDEYVKVYRGPEPDGFFVAYVSVSPGGEGLHFVSIDGKEVAYQSFGGEGRKLFNQVLMREFRKYFGARRNPGKKRAPRSNPNTPRLGSPSGWANQIRVFDEMPTATDPTRPLYYGEYYGRHLAQHYIFGAKKEIPGGSVMAGLSKDRMYPDWTTEDHLGLVAYGLIQLSRIRSTEKRDFVLACFLRDITNVLGDVDRVQEYPIIYAMKQS